MGEPSQEQVAGQGASPRTRTTWRAAISHARYTVGDA